MFWFGEMVNYTGLTEAEVLLAFYKGSYALGMGRFQRVAGLTLADVEEELKSVYAGAGATQRAVDATLAAKEAK